MQGMKRFKFADVQKAMNISETAAKICDVLQAFHRFEDGLGKAEALIST